MTDPELETLLAPRAVGAPVSIALGTMNFGKRTKEDEARRIVARALERGVRVFDTANVYGDGTSERILGRALRLGLGRDRARVLVATKVGLRRREGRAEGLAPDRVLASIDESLDALAIDHIDLLYLHAPDPRVPIDETLDALGRAISAKKIGAWAVSNFASWEILEAIHAARARALPPPRVTQVLYNLLVRQIEVEHLRFARKYALHVTVFNALAGGLLSGKHTRESRPAKGSRFDGNRMYLERYWSERFFERVDAYAAIARDLGLSAVELAYRWLAAREGVDSILVGPGTVEHLDAAIDAVEGAPLAADALTAIDRLHRDAEGTDARYAR